MQLEKPVKIIDKTLLYLAPTAKTAYISEYCRNMLDTGVRLFEIDINFKHLGYVDPRNLLFRLNLKSDLEYGKVQKIRKFIIDTNALSVEEFLPEDLTNLILTLEFSLSEGENIDDDFVAKAITSAGRLVMAGADVKSIRISNVNTFIPEKNLQNLIASLGRHKIELDLCCSDEYFIATSIAIASVSSNTPIISGSFSGISLGVENPEPSHLNTCIEEVMASLNVLTGKNKFNLKNLQRTKAYYEPITGETIDKYKAILGRDIFKYESGIHASAISKSPDTYEPFNPSNVGLERELCIGKHSGTEAIRQLLMTIGINASPENLAVLLEKVRTISIKQKDSLSLSQLYELYMCK